MPPTVADILQQVQRIQILANRTVNDLFAGAYHSVFRGRGMEFDEVREYQPGDDIRSIDWNVTARAGLPFIKRYREERELTVLLLVDVSASGAFGSVHRTKFEAVVEIAAVLMFAALKNNDKVGLILFCDTVVDYFPPRKSKGHVLHLIRELLSVGPVARETRIDAALEFLNRVQKRRAVVFLISDFLAPDAGHALTVANRRHDLIAAIMSDPRESRLVAAGFVRLRDAETGELVELDSGSSAVRQAFEHRAGERRAALARVLQRAGVDALPLGTQEDSVRSLRRFFAMRERRQR